MGAIAAPSRSWVVPAAVAPTGGAQELAVFNPGAAPVRVTIQPFGNAGPAGAETVVSVPAGRTVTLKIRLRPFRTYTRSRTIEAHTRDPALIGRVAHALLAAFERDAPVRLLGVGIASLTRDAPEEDDAGQARLELTA